AVDAVAALRHLLLHVSLLDRMRLLGRAQASEGDDLAAHRRHRRHAGSHRLAVDVHGAGAALRQAAAEMRVVERELAAQRVEQRHVGIGIDGLDLAIHVEGHSGHGCMSPWGCRELPMGHRASAAVLRAIANGSRVTKLVQGAGIGNSLTQLCCEGVPAPAAQELARAYPESTANARTDAIKSRTCVSEMPRVMNTSRL